MSVSRMIDTGMWNDSRFEEFTMAAKYVFVYLLTTPVASLCGCYEIGSRRVSVDTGLDRESVDDAFQELETAGVIDADYSTHEIMLVNWAKHNWNRSPKLNKPLADSIERVKSLRLKRILVEKYQNTRKIPYPYPIDTVSIPYEYPIDTVSIPHRYNTDTATNTNTISIPITSSSNGNDSSNDDSIGEIQKERINHDQDESAFVSEALILWNNITGSQMRRFPDGAVSGLINAYFDGRTLDDIRAVIEHVMTWEPRYRTPSGAFSGGKIEQWLNRPKESVKPKPPKTSPCPKCQSTCNPTETGGSVFHCGSCGITWRAE